MQFLKALKPTISRALSALFSSAKKFGWHLLTHPFKTIWFIFKAYILLMLFAFFLAFSVGSFASQTPLTCPDGGTPLSAIGGCGQQAPEKSCFLNQIQFRSGSTNYTFTSVDAMNTWYSTYNTTNNGPYSCQWNQTIKHNTSVVNTISFDSSCPQGGLLTKTVPGTFTTTTTSVNSTGGGTYPDLQCTITPLPPTVVTALNNMTLTYQLADQIHCPPAYPIGPVQYDDGQTVGKYCYYIPEPPREPCDCSELNGEGSFTHQSFVAANNAYSQQNPPQCLSIRDSDNPLTACNCQIVATKWFSQVANINGVEMTRWQPLPTPDQNGQSGIFTGKGCGEQETTTPPGEKENCVTMKNGQKLCVAEKAEKCIVIDGIQQCQTSCGTVNGEFVCADTNSNQNPDDPLPQPDDEISDPDKTNEQMTKQDFKDVNKGVETRLDLLAKLVEQQNNKGTSTGAANGAKIDTTNRLLADMNNKLGQLVAQGDGSGDGDGDGGGEGDINPQPDYGIARLEQAYPPNNWENKNFKTVMLNFIERVQDAPIFSSIGSFFDVSLNGSCPVWSANIDVGLGFNFAFTVDQHCSEVMTNLWPKIRAIIILICTFFGFRVATTND